MKGPGAKSFRLGKILSRVVVVVAALFLLLLIPERERPAPAGAGRTPFVWNQDALWTNLERQFLEARTAGCPTVADRITNRFADAESLVAEMGRTPFAPDAAQFDRLETPDTGAGARDLHDAMPNPLTRAHRVGRDRGPRHESQRRHDWPVWGRSGARAAPVREQHGPGEPVARPLVGADRDHVP